jgi:hypothetical protein
MSKVCIVIPDGTGIRNYLYSDLVKELLNKKCEIVLLHSISPKAIDEISRVHNQSFKTYKLPEYKETIYQKFLRETICYARLLHNKKLVNNASILDAWKPNTSNFKKKLFYKLVTSFGFLVSNNYRRILHLEEKHTASLTKSCEQQILLLKEIQPTIIFSTHQRAMNALPLINAAQQLGIKTIGAIFSWDNLPKARLTVKTSSYIVWSTYMKDELKLYYPEIDSNKIKITGTPQFEFYFKKEFIIDKEVFYSKYNIDASKKIICFSGDDVRTSPFDPQYLNDIASVIENENLAIQILLRRAPVDVSGRFNAIISKFPNTIKEAPPLWNFDKEDTNNWQIIYPTYQDIELLVSTVNYADAVINVGSTMAHDFAMYNKPAIYLNYNSVISKEWNIETIYQFQHFKSMNNLHPVLWLNSKNDIKKVLNCILEVSKLDNIKWLNIIAENREKASVEIANTLLL